MEDQGGIAEVSVKHMEEFAHAGFRTLCIAEREIDEAEFESWASRFRVASIALDDREEKLAEAADSIEREMVVLGVTAVEDKLQDGVQETVTLLAQAGIKLWVLTGDKLETAVAIGLACNLLVDSMHLFLLCESSFNSVPQMLHSMLDEARQRTHTRSSSGLEASDMALIIEGDSLSVALEENNRINFLELCQECRAVVCCRVSPLQKALVTQLVKETNFAVTLAIGDGANDVAMIKAANIGVGISGREGMAAVLASDYAIGQFRFLARLLLIHGRWEDGAINGIFNLGVAAYTIAIVVVNLKIVTCTNSFTILSILVVWVVSILSYFIFIPVISLMGMTIGSFNDLSDVGFKMYVSTSFWLVLFLGVVTAFLPDWTLSKLQRQCTPEDFEVCQEIEHGWRDGAYSKKSGYVGPLTKRSSQTSQERDSQENSMLELVPFPTRKVRPSSHLDAEELPSRRRMTWREVLSEIDLEAISRAEMEHGWARRVSNGFEVVTRHSDITTIPKPLEEGPLPLFRLRTV